MQKKIAFYVCMAVITFLGLRFYILSLRPFMLRILLENSLSIHSSLRAIGIFILGGVLIAGGVATFFKNRTLLSVWTFKTSFVLISGGILAVLGAALCTSVLLYLFFDIP